MDFHFSAYTPEELLLASEFLVKLAKLQEKRMVKDCLAGQANPVYPFEGNLRPPPGSVAAGMPRSNTTGAPPWES
jgi:hypothetical protein